MCRADVHSPRNIQDRNDKAERRLQIIFCRISSKVLNSPSSCTRALKLPFWEHSNCFHQQEICKAFSGCPQCFMPGARSAVPQVGCGRAGDGTEHPSLALLSWEHSSDRGHPTSDWEAKLVRWICQAGVIISHLAGNDMALTT